MTIRAANLFQVKTDVLEQLWVAGFQEIAAELIAGRATDPFAPPDRFLVSDSNLFEFGSGNFDLVKPFCFRGEARFSLGNIGRSF